MPPTTAIVSLLQEDTQRNSAGRQFRQRPVLAWTLDRLARARSVTTTIILCWEDQLGVVQPVAGAAGARVFSKPRTSILSLDQISAAQRWSDGWRGGLLGTCHFDRGFHAATILEALSATGRPQSAILLVDPSAGLVDPQLLDALAAHANDHPQHELYFTQSAPGLAGALLRPALVERLAKSSTHPGRLLSYWPDTPGRDPMTTDMNMPVPPAIARTLGRFTLDSDRQVRRIAAATAGLNGQLISASAEQLVTLLDAYPAADDLYPREVTLELNTRRATRPIFSPVTHLQLGRGDMTLDAVREVLDPLRGIDDLRLTLGGAGDPLLHSHFPAILKLIGEAQIPSVHLETDLVSLPDEHLDALLAARIDVLTLHLPAATQSTYQQVMGIDALAIVIDHLKKLLARRRTLPLIVPTFTKCRANLAEMEPWYDHWLRALGVAVIAGPSDYAGQIPDHACADMSPPRRRPCARLDTRMTVLSDGTIPTCEQDVLARQPVGHARDGVAAVWRERFPAVRSTHASRPLCVACKEWHRP